MSLLYVGLFLGLSSASIIDSVNAALKVAQNKSALSIAANITCIACILIVGATTSPNLCIACRVLIAKTLGEYITEVSFDSEDLKVDYLRL
jgi:hypothetical protein